MAKTSPTRATPRSRTRTTRAANRPAECTERGRASGDVRRAGPRRRFFWSVMPVGLRCRDASRDRCSRMWGKANCGVRLAVRPHHFAVRHLRSTEAHAASRAVLVAQLIDLRPLVSTERFVLLESRLLAALSPTLYPFKERQRAKDKCLELDPRDRAECRYARGDGSFARQACGTSPRAVRVNHL
jgi:hypothetical protein